MSVAKTIFFKTPFFCQPQLEKEVGNPTLNTTQYKAFWLFIQRTKHPQAGGLRVF